MTKITKIEKSQFNNEVYEDIWVTLELDKNDYEWVENDYGRYDTLIIENVYDFSNITIGDEIKVEFKDMPFAPATQRRVYMKVVKIIDNKIICK